MVSSGHGLQHHHVKKRKWGKGYGEYLDIKKWDKYLTPIIYFFGIFGQLMTVPQITKIWVYQSAAGVSLISWIAYLITAFFWLFYGIVHKSKPIIITYTIWILLQLMIVIGIVLYG